MLCGIVLAGQTFSILLHMPAQHLLVVHIPEACFYLFFFFLCRGDGGGGSLFRDDSKVFYLCDHLSAKPRLPLNTKNESNEC